MAPVLDGIQKEITLEGILLIHGRVPPTIDMILAEFPYLLENPNKLIAVSATNCESDRNSSGKCVALSLTCLIFGRDSYDLALGHVLASSAVRVLKRLYRNDEFQIKWPNEIFLRHMKVGAVFVHSHTGPADFRIANLGIGISLDVPERLFWPDGSINKVLDLTQDEHVIRRNIAIEFYHDLACWRHVGLRPFVPEISKELMALNEIVTLSFTNGESTSGLLTGITDEGFLRLQLKNGATQDFRSGRITSC